MNFTSFSFPNQEEQGSMGFSCIPSAKTQLAVPNEIAIKFHTKLIKTIWDYHQRSFFFRVLWSRNSFAAILHAFDTLKLWCELKYVYWMKFSNGILVYRTTDVEIQFEGLIFPPHRVQSLKAQKYCGVSGAAKEKSCPGNWNCICGHIIWSKASC